MQNAKLITFNPQTADCSGQLKLLLRERRCSDVGGCRRKGIGDSFMMTQYFLVVFAMVCLYHFEMASQHRDVIKAFVSVGLQMLRAAELRDWTKWIPKNVHSTVPTYLTLCHSHPVV